MSPARFWICSGQGPALGRGHARRMTVLARLLEERGHQVELDLASGVRDFTAEITVRADRIPPNIPRILDARDVDPRPFRAGGPLLALDNRHPSRGELEECVDPGLVFYDTLPHPELDPKAVLDRFLLAPELRDGTMPGISAKPEAPATTAEERDARDPGPDLLSYSGAAGAVDLLDGFLLEYARRFPEKQVARIGLAPITSPTGAPSNFEHFQELPPADFLAALRSARIVLAYFGMTLLEAWCAGARPVLFAIDSPVHDVLSRTFSKRTGIPYIKSADDWDGLAEILARPTDPRLDDLRPDGRGYERLIERLEGFHS